MTGHAPNLTVPHLPLRGKLDHMRIVVCVKQVPDGDSDRRLEDSRVVRGEDDVLNELDEYAVEAAVTLVEDRGGEVIAVTMGPEDAEDAVMRALQMGADQGILVSDELLEGSDAPATAAVLAAVVEMLTKDEPVDMVITGMASLDGMTSMVAPGIAANLDWPLLDLASELQVDDDMVVTAKRIADGWEDELTALVPVVVSVTDQINEPRYPSFKDLRAARSKPLETLGLQDLAGFDHGQQLLPRAREKGLAAVRVIASQPVEREVGVIVTDSGDGGARLADYLRTAGVIDE